MNLVPTPQSRCRFGIARADITPPVGIYHRMWGAASHDRSEGVHRPLTATAMHFAPVDGGSDPAAQQTLVAIDHCLLGRREVGMLLDRAVERQGIAREALTVTFSHTHAAGLLNFDRQGLPGGELIPEYLERLADTVAGIVGDAVRSTQPADIVYGLGSCRLAAHRDYFDPQQGEYVCGYNPDGAADDTVAIARVTDAHGQRLATIVNYACHPTTLAWDNRQISPDYPGAMRDTIEQTTAATCVFLHGASGDLGPVEGYVGDTATADRNGRQLAFAALSALEGLPPANRAFRYAGKVVSGAAIGTWEYVPIDEARAARISAWATARQPIPLAYRADLPRREEVEARHAALLAQEQAARAAGKSAAAAEYRALAERQTRMLGRLNELPPGDHFPYQAIVWRMGDAIWVAVQGEPYNLLQRQLRASFPGTPIIVSTVANGWGPSYLPPRELYGQGMYQESIASLAPGSLEQLIEALTTRIKALLTF